MMKLNIGNVVRIKDLHNTWAPENKKYNNYVVIVEAVDYANDRFYADIGYWFDINDVLFVVDDGSFTTDTDGDGDNDMVLGYKTYNNKVVIVDFIDGTSEKVTCCDDEAFDLETGIEKCVIKKLYGKNYARNIIKKQEQNDKALKQIEENKIKEQQKIELRAQKAREKHLRYLAARELELEKIKKELKKQ